MGKCGSTYNKDSQILIAGIENSLKSNFIYNSLKCEKIENNGQIYCN